MKKGIDVSSWQGNIDFGKVKASGVDFVIIRAGYGRETSQKDNCFEQNYKNAKAAGLDVGAYWYSYADSTEDAIREAKACLTVIKGKKFDLPVYFDLEEQNQFAKGKAFCDSIIQAFCDEVKKNGYNAGLYCSTSPLNNYVSSNIASKYPLWVAQYNDKCTYTATKYQIWQYSDKGSVKGINGKVDMNWLYDTSIYTQGSNSISTATETITVTISDRDKFLETARSYIGKNGAYVCKTKLNLDKVYDWCAFAISAIMKDCGFIGKYQGGIYSYASDNARNDNGKYGTWFLKGSKTPQAGDLIMFKYASFTNPIDKYSASHIGIVESVNVNTITTLEGNVDGDNANWAETSSFKRKTRYLSNSDIYSFFRLNWEKTTITSTATSTTNSTTTNKANIQITELSSSTTVNYSVKVTSNDGVNIRAGASVTKTIIGAVPYNTILKVTKQTSGGGYTWGLITYNNITGWIALEYTKKIEAAITFKTGDKVKVKNGAVVYGTNQKFSSFVYQTTYQIMEISGNRIVIGINGQVMSAIDKKYLIKV